MNIEELVKMPEPADTHTVWSSDGLACWKEETEQYTSDQRRAYGEAVAAAVAKRCADLCESKAGTSEYDDSTSRYLAQDIRREFGEVSK